MWHAKLWWNDDGIEQNIEIDNNCPNKLNYKVELQWNFNIFFSSRLLNCEMQLENSKLVVGCCTWNRYTTWWLQWKCHFSRIQKKIDWRSHHVHRHQQCSCFHITNISRHFDDISANLNAFEKRNHSIVKVHLIF